MHNEAHADALAGTISYALFTAAYPVTRATDRIQIRVMLEDWDATFERTMTADSIRRRLRENAVVVAGEIVQAMDGTGGELTLTVVHREEGDRILYSQSLTIHRVRPGDLVLWDSDRHAETAGQPATSASNAA